MQQLPAQAEACHIQARPPVLAGQVENKPGIHQCLCLQKQFQLFTASRSSSGCFNISKWISFIYTLGAFQISAFVLDPGVSETSPSPFKRGSSFPIALWAP